MKIMARRGYWYTLKHGYGPGTLPKNVHVLTVTDDGWDTIVELDRELTPDELDYYDIRSSRKIGTTAVKASRESQYKTFQIGSQKFSVDYEDSILDFNAPKFQMSEIHPYDDAEYTWANHTGNNIVVFYRNGKKVDQMTLWDFDKYEDESYDEYFHQILNAVGEELLDLNRDVKPVMVHN